MCGTRGPLRVSFPASILLCSFRVPRLRVLLNLRMRLWRIDGGADWVFDKMAEAPASPMGGGSHESGGEQSPQSGGVREQDRYLPIANISRIMKKALPANGKIAKDAKDTVQECVSEFISFITSEASDKCQKEKRKTINGDDLLWAMATLGFEDYIEPLKVYLARYRELEGDTKGSARGGDGSARKDVSVGQPGQNVQYVQQASLTHPVGYMNPQYGQQGSVNYVNAHQ